MRRYCVWSSFVAITALVACGGSSADDLYKDDKFGTALRGGSGSFTSGGAVVVYGGASAVGGGGSSSGGTGSTGGSATSTGGSASSTGGSGSGGSAGATHGGTGGTLSSGGSSLGGAAGKGGSGGVAGKGGSSGSGGSSDKTCDQLLMELPDLLGAAQACMSSSATACNGFVKNHCGCMVAVNETGSPATKAYTDSVTSLTSQCGVLCTGVVCATVTAASCVTSGTGSSGHCLGR